MKHLSLVAACAASMALQSGLQAVRAEAAASAVAVGGRLFYEIVVTAPGTRSQGWHGVLYGEDGREMVVPEGETVSTALGSFTNVPCEHMWSTCGLIHEDMIEWMKAHQANVILDSKPWSYVIDVDAEGTKSEGWTGLLTHGGEEVLPLSGRTLTPMGPFVVQGSGTDPWGVNGWYPESWSNVAGGGPSRP